MMSAKPRMTERELIFARLDRAKSKSDRVLAFRLADDYLSENPADFEMLEAREALANRSEARCMLRSFSLSLVLAACFMVLALILGGNEQWNWSLVVALVVPCLFISVLLMPLVNRIMVRVTNPRHT